MNNSTSFRISNEQLLLINILNSMYNDNLRQINNITDTLNNLNDNNNNIRNLLVQILNTSPQTNNTNVRRGGHSERRYRENNDRNRVPLTTTPYIIDYIAQYNVPRTNLNNRNTSSTLDTSVRSLIGEIFSNFMEPIEVHPTQSQIESATRQVRYCDISRPINTQCPISMDDFNDNDMVTVIRPCGHIFHTEHIMNWFRTNYRCPVCRYDIRDYNSNTSREIFNNSNQNNITAQNRSNVLYPEVASFDMSYNNVERSSTNNLSNELYNRVLNEYSIITDPSGNSSDNMLAGAALLMSLINGSSTNRTSR